MAQDRLTQLFFEMFSGLPRQGPGDAASTLEALALVPGSFDLIWSEGAINVVGF